MTVVLWTAAIGVWLFVIIFLLDGWTRAEYRSIRQPVSALALGTRGWLQTTNFVQCGAAAVAGAVGVAIVGDSILLVLVISVFGLSLIASGAFPMDPMRGYPPGAPDGTPEVTSLRHRIHDAAGMIAFLALPVTAAVAAFALHDPIWQWWSGITAAVLAAGFVAFGQAWEDDAPLTGLIQRATMIPGWIWLGALFAHVATR